MIARWSSIVVAGGMIAGGVVIGTAGRALVHRMSTASPMTSASQPTSDAGNQPPRGSSPQAAPVNRAGAAAAAVEPDDPDAEVRSAIERLAAHPDDPDNPSHVAGVSDDDLANADPGEVAHLIQASYDFAHDHLGEPRYMFALGRAALMHGDERLAWDLLVTAAEAGSGAAHAYLAQLADVAEDRDRLLHISAGKGFQPAADWLQDPGAQTRSGGPTVHRPVAPTASVTHRGTLAPAPPQTAPPATHAVDFDAFNRPDLIRAFHAGDVGGLDGGNMLQTVAYASSVNETLSDSQVLFLVQDPRIKLELDPQLSYHASRKILGTQRGTEQATMAGLGMLGSIFGSMVEVRQRGGSIMEEVQATNTAMLNSPIVQLDIVKKQARQDGERLALMYDADPETFRKIYAGLRRYLMQ